MMSHAQAHTDAHPAHPYHLVDPSPWPLVGGVSAFILAFGAITYFHDHGQKWGLLLGLALVVVTMIGWWREVIREARAGQATRRCPQVQGVPTMVRRLTASRRSTSGRRRTTRALRIPWPTRCSPSVVPRL